MVPKDGVLGGCSPLLGGYQVCIHLRSPPEAQNPRERADNLIITTTEGGEKHPESVRRAGRRGERQGGGERSYGQQGTSK